MRLIVILTAFAVLSCGCGSQPRQKRDDAAVLAAACAWLDTNIGERIPSLTRLQVLNDAGELEPAVPSVPRQILILPTCFTLTSTDQLVVDLDGVEQPELIAMIESIVDRNGAENPIQITELPDGFQFAPKDWAPHSRFFRRDNPGVQGWLSFHQPGYNQTGDTALVRLWFGPTAHGAVWYFLLHQSDGRWEVTWQSAQYYA